MPALSKPVQSEPMFDFFLRFLVKLKCEMFQQRLNQVVCVKDDDELNSLYEYHKIQLDRFTSMLARDENAGDDKDSYVYSFMNTYVPDPTMPGHPTVTYIHRWIDIHNCVASMHLFGRRKLVRLLESIRNAGQSDRIDDMETSWLLKFGDELQEFTLLEKVPKEVAIYAEQCLIKAFGPDSCVNRNESRSKIESIGPENDAEFAFSMLIVAVMKWYDPQLELHLRALQAQ